MDAPGGVGFLEPHFQSGETADDRDEFAPDGAALRDGKSGDLFLIGLERFFFIAVQCGGQRLDALKEIVARHRLNHPIGPFSARRSGFNRRR
jgi:hypothetical protein